MVLLPEVLVDQVGFQVDVVGLVGGIRQGFEKGFIDQRVNGVDRVFAGGISIEGCFSEKGRIK